MDAAQQPELVLFEKQGVRFGEAWFLEPASLPSTPRIDVLLQQHVKQPPRKGLECSRTLIFDLAKPEEALWNGIKQETRYKIRRADERDALVFEVHDAATLRPGNEALAEFVHFYRLFARQKGLADIKTSYIDAQARAGVLWLTCARKDGKALAWHSYIGACGRARLRNSASHFRTEDSQTSNLIGRANRWLHWQDMRMFRAERYHHYDFGGWYAGDEDADRLRINRFKEAFGGISVTEYSGVTPLSIRGHSYVLARSALIRLRVLRRQSN